MSLTIKTTGNYNDARSFIANSGRGFTREELTKIANTITDELIDATKGYSSDVGNGWSYEIIINKKKQRIIFNNSAVVNGVNVAIMLDVGHATRDGKWISGLHYIDPILRRTCESIVSKDREEFK